MEHWAEDDARRLAFLSLCEQMGVEDPMGILGVEHLKEFRGTLPEAVQIVNGEAGAVQFQERLYQDAKNLPEAVVTANASFQTPRGGVWQVTLRPILSSDLMVAAMKNLVTGIEVFEAAVVRGRKWSPVQRYSQIPAVGSGSSGQGPSTGHAGEMADLYTRKGAGELTSLTVKSGKFEYEVAGRKFSINDSRGVEVATTYWHEDCFTSHFSKEHLEDNGIWTRSEFGQKLLLRYGKNKDTGYWDALAVFPAPNEGS